MSFAPDIRLMAKAQPTAYTAHLKARITYTLPENAKPDAQVIEVFEPQALKHIRVPGWMQERENAFRTRIEAFSLEWRADDNEWVGDENLLEVQTQADYSMEDGLFAAQLIAGTADFAPIRPYEYSLKHRDRLVRNALLSRLDARIYLLEQARHTITLLKDPRIGISREKVRVIGTYALNNAVEEAYMTGEKRDSTIKTRAQAEALLTPDLL